MDLACIYVGLKDDQIKDAGEHTAKREISYTRCIFSSLKGKNPKITTATKNNPLPSLSNPPDCVRERQRMGDGSLLTI